MRSEKNSAHVWVRQKAPVKIYSSISVNVWERKNQLICILVYYPPLSQKWMKELYIMLFGLNIVHSSF